MSFKTEIKTKYTNIGFFDDYDGEIPFTWISINMAWTDKETPEARLFHHLCDEKLLKILRSELTGLVEDVNRDIRLEDCSVLINVAPGQKHRAAPIPGIVKSVEAMFDIESNPRIEFET